jgi:alpha-tubulin suppressor-like RCC1 family protein
VWSWGCGTYGQLGEWCSTSVVAVARTDPLVYPLGHRDTWDALLPRSVDEIRREKIRFIDAGERHSLAMSESMELWVWGNGIHGDIDLHEPDPASSSVLLPIKVYSLCTAVRLTSDLNEFNWTGTATGCEFSERACWKGTDVCLGGSR